MSEVGVEQIDFTSKEFKLFKENLDNVIASQTKEDKAEIEQFSLKVKMESYLEDVNSEGKEVGEFIIEFLKNVGISQSRLATLLSIRPSNLNKILKGDRRMNMAVAVQIGQILELDPILLIQIQAKNELSKYSRSNRTKGASTNYKDLLK